MVSLFIQWLYFDAPKANFTFFRDLCVAFFNYFSIPLLGRTLFDPWRHDAVDMSRLPLAYWGRAIMNNFVSRFIGFMLRSIVIFSGFFMIAVTSVIGLVFSIAWYLLPLLMFLSLFYGFSLLIGGFNA